LTETTIQGVGKIMCLSQPAISQRLCIMSNKLDYKLHVRHGRGMILTVKGRQLAEAAKAALFILESLSIEPDIETKKLEPVEPIKVYVPPPKKKPDIPFQITGRSMCFSYMKQK